MSVTPMKEYYSYSNGAYELKKITTIPDNSPIAKTEVLSRKITGPIPREDLAKLVEHIDLNSPKWQEEMQDVLTKAQFVAIGIHADAQPNPAMEIGMTREAYVKSYLTWKTASTAAVSVITFFMPALLASYAPQTVVDRLHLRPFEEQENSATYSVKAWSQGLNFISDQVQQRTDLIPSYIKSPVISYIGYKGLESLVETAIKYPATDYKTWTALNLQSYLQDVYPQTVPIEYRDDAVLKETMTPELNPIRSPFIISNEVELGQVYEEHVLKNILSNQQKTKSKMFCPKDGKTEIQLTDVKRDELHADRIELRLLLLDAHRYKTARMSAQKV